MCTCVTDNYLNDEDSSQLDCVNIEPGIGRYCMSTTTSFKFAKPFSLEWPVYQSTRLIPMWRHGIHSFSDLSSLLHSYPRHASLDLGVASMSDVGSCTTRCPWYSRTYTNLHYVSHHHIRAENNRFRNETQLFEMGLIYTVFRWEEGLCRRRARDNV